MTEMLLGMLDGYQDQMCQIIDEHVPPFEKIQPWVVDADTSLEEFDSKLITLEEYDELFREYGCTICHIPREGIRLTGFPIAPEPGGRQTVRSPECRKAGGEVLGSYHTHPFMLPVPSTVDIENHLQYGYLIGIVGGRVGRRRVLVGYGSNEYSKIKYEMNQKIDPYPGDIWKGVEKIVRTMNRSASSRQAEEIEYVGMIPVYDELTVVKQFWTQVESLKRSFDVVVRWC